MKNLSSKIKVDSHKKFLCYERKEKSNPFYLPKNWFYVRGILVNVDACGKCRVGFLYLLPRDLVSQHSKFVMLRGFAYCFALYKDTHN